MVFGSFSESFPRQETQIMNENNFNKTNSETDFQKSETENSLKTLKSIEKTGFLFMGLVLILGALFWGPGKELLSLGIGALLGIVNFSLLKSLLLKITSENATQVGAWSALLALKILLLLGLVALLLFQLDIEVLPFVGGFFVIVIAITIQGIKPLFYNK